MKSFKTEKKSSNSKANANNNNNNNKKRLVVVVRRPKKRQRPIKAKRGLPNLTKELTEPPPEDDDTNDDDDAILFPIMDDIPCDTLLAFQSLTSPATPHLCLPIPLQASTEPIATILESQLYGVIQQDQHDHDGLAMITSELQDLFHKNILRRLSSISTAGGVSGRSTNLIVLILAKEYVRGVWDALDATDDATTTTTTMTSSSYPAENLSNNPQQRAVVHRLYVQWFVEHLHRWTGQTIRNSQLVETWARHAPSQDVAYEHNVILRLSDAVEYWQRLQILMPANNNNTHASNVGVEDTYQLWLPTWGETLATVQKAQTKFVQKVRLTSQKEVSEFSFVQQQPYYKNVSTKFLLQWMLDCGMVQLVPKPFGNFIRLVQQQQQQQRNQSSSGGGGGNKKRRKY